MGISSLVIYMLINLILNIKVHMRQLEFAEMQKETAPTIVK